MFKSGITLEELHQALDPRAPRESIKKLLEYCHDMAIAYLRMRAALGAFPLSGIGLTLEDAALDSIAELFRRDTNGVYPAFRGILRTTEVDPGGYHHELRRLVLGAVNQYIFRSFKQFDPGLARLIRNIKGTLKSHATARLARLNEDAVVVPQRGELLLHLPLIAEELMRIEFWSSASVGSSLRDHLSLLVQILHRQSAYRRVYPVTAFALLIRVAYQRQSCEGQTVEEGQLTDIADIMTVAEQIVGGITRHLLDAYCASGKLSRNDASAYEKATADILYNTFVQADGDSTSYFEILHKHMAGLTTGEYARSHRTKLEYAAKQAKEAMRLALQKEFSFSAGRDDRNDGRV